MKPEPSDLKQRKPEEKESDKLEDEEANIPDKKPEAPAEP